MASPGGQSGSGLSFMMKIKEHPVAATAGVLLILAASVAVAAGQAPVDPLAPTPTATMVTAKSNGVTPTGSVTTATVTTSTSPSAQATLPRPTATAPAELAAIIDSRRFSYEPGWGTTEVQAFLDSQPGILKTASYQAGGQRIPISAAIADQTLLYSVNPKVVLTLLEMESGIVRKPSPGPNEIGWAVGYRQDKYWGVGPQVNWVTRELYRSAREDQKYIVARGWGSYAVARVLSETVDKDTQGWTFERAAAAFTKTYRELFGEDPRTAPGATHEVAKGPFLRPPFGVANVVVSSAFDHEYPLLNETGSMLTYRAKRDQSSYDGHDGWDYVLGSGTPVLAAAAGRVVVAGWSDDGCASAAGAVVLDHDNGYRSLYWHLSTVGVTVGTRVVAGDQLGKSGNTGCSLGAHLHFGLQFLGRSTDPYGWCPQGDVKGDPWAAHPAGVPSVWLWTDRASPCAGQ